MSSILALAFQYSIGISQLIPVREFQANVILVDKVPTDHRPGIFRLQLEYYAAVHRPMARAGTNVRDDRINFLGDWFGHSQYKCHRRTLPPVVRSARLDRVYCDGFWEVPGVFRPLKAGIQNLMSSWRSVTGLLPKKDSLGA